MPADFSRSTYTPRKHYSRVLQQQGRVQLDADWNEQQAINMHHRTTAMADLVGPQGTPADENGFLLTPTPDNADLVIHPGRFYVNGLLCELEEHAAKELSNEFVKITTPANASISLAKADTLQIKLPTLTVDGQDLAVKDWVELLNEVGHPIKTDGTFIDTALTKANTTDLLRCQISEVDPDTPSITLDFEKYAGGGTPVTQLRRSNCLTENSEPYTVRLKLSIDEHAIDEQALREGQWIEFLDQAGAVLNTSGKTKPGDSYTCKIIKISGNQVTFTQRSVADLGTVPFYAIRPVTTYLIQPHLASPTAIDKAKTYLAYLDVWERTVTALEDPDIREVALNDADTAARSQIVWQVKLYDTGIGKDEFNAVNTAQPTQIDTAFKGFTDTQRPATSPGQMVAQPASSQVLENQLYRFEIHDNNHGMFKWARDNASVVTLGQLNYVDGTITLQDLGRNTISGFINCPWVEVMTQAQHLSGEVGTIFALKANQPVDLTLEINTDDPSYGAAQGASASLTDDLIVRRWDGYQAMNEALTNGPFSVTFFPPSGGELSSFHPGDYWLVPTRTDLPQGIDWPTGVGADNTTVSLLQPPLGIRHAYGQLALVRNESGTLAAKDGRPQFASLSQGPANLLSKTGGELSGALTFGTDGNNSNTDIQTVNGVKVGGTIELSPAVSNNEVYPHIRLDGAISYLLLGPSTGQLGIKWDSGTKTVTLSGYSGNAPDNFNSAFNLIVNGAISATNLDSPPNITTDLVGKSWTPPKLTEESVNTSDERLKQNIQPINQAVDKVLQLEGVQFEWNEAAQAKYRFSNRKRLGVVAQAVEQVVPEAVSVDSEGFQKVDYGQLVSLLIEAIKTLQAEIQILKKQVIEEERLKAF